MAYCFHAVSGSLLHFVSAAEKLTLNDTLT